MSTRPLSSRERLLTTFRHEEPDHVPLCSLWWPDSQVITFASSMERVSKVLAMGLDDTLRLEAPHRIRAGVRHDLLSELDYETRERPLAGLAGVETKVWMERPEGASHPLMHKEYVTAAGTLRQVVRRSDDWVAGMDIPLTGGFADLNVSGGVEHLLKGPEDLEKLECLLQAPSEEQLRDFRERAAEMRRFAERRGVLLEGGWVEWGDAMVWLMGIERLIFALADEPEFVEQALEMMWRYEQRRIEIVLAAGAEVITHRGWYHTTDFWTPANYRRFLKPLLAKEIEAVHEAGALYKYIRTKDVRPYYQDFLDLGVDILWGVDPVQDTVRLGEIKGAIGDRISIAGGVNSFVTLGRGKEEEIRSAVREAVRTLGPGGGFVLYPVDQIDKSIPRGNVEIMIDEWRKVRGYPVRC